MKTELLPVELSAEERSALAERLSARIGELRELTDENKDKKRAMKAAEDKLKLEIERLATMHRTGYEARQVEVMERPDPEHAVMLTVRCDTGEVVHSRPMSAAELAEARQIDLPGMN